MKTTLLILILPMLGTFASAADLATLCPVSIDNETAALFGDSPQHILGASGVVYKACWSAHELPNSGTHTNINVQALEKFLPTFPTLGKSVAISGITDPDAFLAAIGAVRCDALGNELTTGETP